MGGWSGYEGTRWSVMGSWESGKTEGECEGRRGEGFERDEGEIWGRWIKGKDRRERVWGLQRIEEGG